MSEKMMNMTHFLMVVELESTNEKWRCLLPTVLDITFDPPLHSIETPSTFPFLHQLQCISCLILLKTEDSDVPL